MKHFFAKKGVQALQDDVLKLIEDKTSAADKIYRLSTERPTAQRLLEAYRSHETALVSKSRVDAAMSPGKVIDEFYDSKLKVWFSGETQYPLLPAPGEAAASIETKAATVPPTMSQAKSIFKQLDTQDKRIVIALSDKYDPATAVQLVSDSRKAAESQAKKFSYYRDLVREKAATNQKIYISDKARAALEHEGWEQADIAELSYHTLKRRYKTIMKNRKKLREQKATEALEVTVAAKESTIESSLDAAKPRSSGPTVAARNAILTTDVNPVLRGQIKVADDAVDKVYVRELAQAKKDADISQAKWRKMSDDERAAFEASVLLRVQDMDEVKVL
jgi:hypothetical protein